MGRPSLNRPSANAATEALEARSRGRCSNLPSAGRREPTSTDAPAAASSAAKARPMPALPPVTTANRPRRVAGDTAGGRDRGMLARRVAIRDLQSVTSGR
jgi:hypothetical protein